MFAIGDFVVHGNTGVCKVKDVGAISMSTIDHHKKYYTLEPVYEPGSVIYTPVDNQKVKLRAALTQEEAQQLVKDIEEIEPLWVSNERQREMIYKEAVKSSDCKEWIKIIKALYLRRQSRLEDGKKTTAMDERYYRIAEHELYGELAVSLSIPKDKVEEYIQNELIR